MYQGLLVTHLDLSDAKHPTEEDMVGGRSTMLCCLWILEVVENVEGKNLVVIGDILAILAGIEIYKNYTWDISQEVLAGSQNSLGRILHANAGYTGFTQTIVIF